MRILGIETSCDETAVCLIDATGDVGPDFKFNVLGNALLSQAKLHEQYGGVFPNLAKREHAKNLVPLLEHALKEANMLKNSPSSTSQRADLRALLAREPELFEQLSLFLNAHEKPEIDAIAVTHGPGLEPCLWVGVNFAKALSLVWNLPIVAVNHMEGHIVMSLVDSSPIAAAHSNTSPKSEVLEFALHAFEFPVLALLISGGHTELVLSRSWQQYELIGQTRDDAAGEAFDKVARMLELPYPGGPEISKLAAHARQKNLPGQILLPRTITLPRPMLHEDNFDFSFSGLKTAARKLIETGQGSTLSDEFKMEVAREFEDAVADVLVGKTMRAIEEYGANTIVVGGGVSANTYIRERLAQALARAGAPAKLLIPPPELATDNALMIALAGYFRAVKKEFIEPANLVAKGNLKLAYTLI
jgi:N6-L-threonylcarbamoyladenine synthase